MSAAQFSYRIRIQARLFRQIGIGNLQAALCFADDIAEIILEWNHNRSGSGAVICKLPMRCAASFSIITAVAGTVTLLPASFSIEVMATFEIPQGVI